MAAFYLDEDVPIELAALLRAQGHDVLTTNQANRKGTSDRSQLEFATEQKRILVSHNRYHFRRLHEQVLTEKRTHAGILLLAQDTPQNLLTKLLEFLEARQLPDAPFCETIVNAP